MSASSAKRGCGVSPQAVLGASRSQSSGVSPKEGRYVIAHANVKPMERATSHLIVPALASADTFRRSLRFHSTQHAPA